jgi:hypothetical protein
MVDVARVRTARQRAEVFAFRQSVRPAEDAAASSRVRDEFDDDPTTVHCIATGPDGACIGTGRLVAPLDTVVDGALVRGNPTIGPIVVAPGAREVGVARAVLAYLEAEALAHFGRNGSVTVEIRVSADARPGVPVVRYTLVERAEAPVVNQRELAAG